MSCCAARITSRPCWLRLERAGAGPIPVWKAAVTSCWRLCAGSRVATRMPCNAGSIGRQPTPPAALRHTTAPELRIGTSACASAPAFWRPEWTRSDSSATCRHSARSRAQGARRPTARAARDGSGSLLSRFRDGSADRLRQGDHRVGVRVRTGRLHSQRDARLRLQSSAGDRSARGGDHRAPTTPGRSRLPAARLPPRQPPYGSTPTSWTT